MPEPVPVADADAALFVDPAPDAVADPVAPPAPDAEDDMSETMTLLSAAVPSPPTLAPDAPVAVPSPPTLAPDAPVAPAAVSA